VLGRKTGAQNMVKELKQYQEKLLQHVQRMDTNSRSVFSDHFSLPLFTHTFLYILLISACSIKYIFSEIGYRDNFVIYPCTPCIYRLCNKSLLNKGQK
jgi:hypothetical protein